jgi:hypothetical protein
MDMTMSANDEIPVLNLETGATGSIRRKWFENPAINQGILVEVDERQKPYVPDLYKSKIVDQGTEGTSPEDTTDEEDDE